MTKTQKLIGSSVLSLLLLAVTMFSMCSVRMQRLNTDGDIDDLAFEELEDGDEEVQEDLLSKLEVLDEEATGDEGSSDFFSELDDENFGDPSTSDDTESFLTPELMADMQAQVNDLEKIYYSKERTADSLRQKVREQQYSDASSSGSEQTRQFTEQAFDNPVFSDITPATPTTSTYSSSSYLDSEVGSLYQDALNDYNNRRFGSAIGKFRSILLRSDTGHLADNCQYWIGESYYAQGKYLQAAAEFEKVNIYPKGNKLTDAQLMTGLSFMKTGDSQQARSEFTALTTFFKNASAAGKATRYLNDLGGV